jgi:uncharacterized protein (DUF302 family)
MEIPMLTRLSAFLPAAFVAALLAFVSPAPAAAQAPAEALPESGVVTVKSGYGFNETVERLKKDVADKGIRFFMAIDQAQLAGEAGIKLNPSTLLIFGNPPLGTQFMTSNPLAGLDWPVRLLVVQDAKGDVYAAYTEFAWIAQRHGIADRQDQFAMASKVIASITSSVAK